MWQKLNLDNIFPTVSSFIVFISYMAMFVAQGMLVTASRLGQSSYAYNTVTVVLITETVKLILSVMAYLREHSMSSLLNGVLRSHRVLLLYLIPAFLYCLYNNISFLSLNYFDPTSYFMFMQTRLVLTGLVYQVLFKKYLSGKQWLSLVLLTAGCMIHAAGTRASSMSSSEEKYPISPNSTVTTPAKSEGYHDLFSLEMGLVFVSIQVFCSVFAGVYNEHLIKGDGADIHIMIQNIFMYIDSIICNIFLLAIKGELLTALTVPALSSISSPFVICLILNNAILGIVTSLFLKQLNSIVKAFASAIELILTAFLSVPILGIPLTIHTMIALTIISVAVVMYAKNPVPVTNTKSQEKISV